MCLPALAWARVGEVLFVYGNAHAEPSAGGEKELQKGTALDEGDRVVTGSNGRLQIRMDDGGLVVLRPLSELVIEQYSYPAAAQGDSAATQTPRSVMSLVRGGLRAITGALGKANPDGYEMRTPVATIGIRGTDYSALYCTEDCADLGVEPGLYVGVAEGAIFVRNAAGTLDLGQAQYGFVQDAQSAPVESRRAGYALALANQAARATGGYANRPRAGAMQAVIAQGAAVIAAPQAPEVAAESTDGKDLTTGALGGEPVAYAGYLAPGFSAAAAGSSSAQSAGANGALTAFSGDLPAGAGRVEHVGGTTLDQGRDAQRAGATGLQWGRWSGGSVVSTVDGASVSAPLGSDSLHWIAAGDATQPQLPTMGRADFELIGNTDPTDDTGHVGTLGSATLGADFTARTVAADLSLSFAQTAQVWKASARAVPISFADATFGGAFDTVSVSGAGAARSGHGQPQRILHGQRAGRAHGRGHELWIDRR